MKTLIDTAKKTFFSHFAKAPDALFQAPGRVNLIGEHTDYNNGFVFPCAIDRGTVMAVSTRADNMVRVVAGSLGEVVSEWAQQLPLEKDLADNWSNYLRGVTEQFLKRGYSPKGMNFVVYGNIPQGAGLSSSASFSVAFATAINLLNQFEINPSDIAKLCQAAENEFVGCNCGIMDQLISAAGQKQKALLIDCADLSFNAISLPEDADILIIDSKVTRGLVDSEYNIRRAQCETAARILGVSTLRNTNLRALERARSEMDTLTFRRARHVITENTRTLTAASALQNGDYKCLSEMMAGSHQSMRDDFEITVPQIDFLVTQIQLVLKHQGGARMTGGGFGGCVVTLAPSHLSKKIIEKIENTYFAETGLKAEIHLCKASAGAGPITL